MNDEELLDDESDGPLAFAAPDQDFEDEDDMGEPDDAELDEIDAEENEGDYL